MPQAAPRARTSRPPAVGSARPGSPSAQPDSVGGGTVRGAARSDERGGERMRGAAGIGPLRCDGEGLAVTRAMYERYSAAKRNPYNEIEASDHYARAMMGFGVYLAACGYEYHGPKGHLGFAPRIHPEDFRAAFTAAEGWGLYRQRRTDLGAR